MNPGEDQGWTDKPMERAGRVGKFTDISGGSSIVSENILCNSC